MDLLFTFHLGQRESGSNIGLLSKPQSFIFKVHINSSSYTSIRKIWKIGNDKVLANT
jgi:hypothetical protein